MPSFSNAAASAERAETAAASVSAIQLPVDTASGAIASFPDGADGVPVEALTVALEPVQDLNGQSSPYPSGGQMWNEQWEEGIYDSTTGEKVTNSNNIRSVGKFSVNAQTTYYAYIGASGKRLKVCYYASDESFISWEAKAKQTFTTPANCAYVAFSTLDSYGTTYLNDISFNSSSTDTAYHPYANICPITGHTAAQVWREATYDTTAQPQITIQLGQTVYGGTLDVVQGVLTVDRAIITLDGTQSISIVNWRPTSRGVGWVYPYSLTNNKLERSDANMPKLVSDSLPTITYGTAFQGTSVGVTTLATTGTTSYGLVVRTADASLTTASAINAYLSAHPIAVCYELATPITIQLTPNELTTLLGTNNIWSDSGDVSVEYRADIQLYIQKMIAEALA
jgi:hypothetical protein